MQELIDKIKSSISLSANAEEYVVSIAKEKKVSKGEVLFRQGEAVKYTYFVKNGCLRAYCMDKSGKEHTLQFAIKDWWISDFIAIYSHELASLTVECIVDADVIAFNAIELAGIYKLYPEFEAFQRNNLERHIVSLHRRILNQLQLSASEQYDLFLQQYTDIEKHVPNYLIASYLGITQQSLSRIRIEKAKE